VLVEVVILSTTARKKM